MMKVCATRGFIPKIVGSPRVVESVFLEVEAGFGIAIMPTSMRKYSADLTFIEIDGDDTKFYDVLAWRKDNRNPSIPLFIKMFELVKAEFA